MNKAILLSECENDEFLSTLGKDEIEPPSYSTEKY